jgi:asparagine synthase (glutamine-hydrolysing)
MCGIAGIVDLDARRPLPRGALAAMSAALGHRGPDEDGAFEQPGIGLACRRLSIVGVANGRQPVASEDGSIRAVCNGELFDYAELRPQLEAAGHCFATDTDVELIPHVWEEHGPAALDRLRGQFAFAVWEERHRRLTLARDRFGICPLYWAAVDDAGGRWLLFASEVRALLASGMVAVKPDPRGIHQLFTFIGVPGPVTCFEGVRTLHPGHSLTIQIGDGGPATVTDRAYWAIDFPDEGDEGSGSERELVDRFEAVLFRAVSRRLRADVPVVSYLSGGVDSSLVVAMASKALGRPIPTFTVRVTGADGLDESTSAAALAGQFGCRAAVVPYGPADLLREYPRLVRAAEAPVIDTSAAASLLLAQRVRADGYKVALTGEGADEWLAGYPWFKGVHAVRWLGRLLGPAVRLHLRTLRAPPGTYDLVRSAEKALGGPNVWLIWSTLMRLNTLRLFSPQMRERLAGHEPFADLELDPERLSRWHPLHRGLGVGARTLMAGMLLSSKGDRVAMHSSVETRYPFLDEEVFAFLARLHPRWKLRGLTSKYLLRRLAERWLPHDAAWRRKAMFRAPLDPFHGPDAPAYVKQLLSAGSLRKAGYFDPAAVAHWQQRYGGMRRGSAARTAAEMGLVGVVATQLWHALFIDPSLADLPAAAPPSVAAPA